MSKVRKLSRNGISRIFPQLFCLTMSVSFAPIRAHAAAPAEALDYADEEQAALTQLLRNTSLPDGAAGAIVAAPSRSNPNYWYHWVRDGSIALRALLAEYEAMPDGAPRRQLRGLLVDHIEFNRKLQATALSDGTGLGEARFTLAGDPVPGPWGSPQEDGPALRVLELAHLADIFSAEGDDELVRSKLYDGKSPTHSVIKLDLEYLAQHWRETSFDIWEELRAKHFYTRLLTWKALRAGSTLATRLGDSGAAAYYLSQANQLAATLDYHWQPWRGYLVESLEADSPSRIRTSGLDSAVIVAVLSGYGRGERGQGDLFGVTDDRVLATVQRLEQVFRDLYPANDPGLGLPGTAIGRYPEDRYDGSDINAVGHSWPFLTAQFAQFYYELAQTLKARGQYTVTELNYGFFAALALPTRVASGTQLVSGDAAFERVYAALRRKGDGFLARVYSEKTPAGGLSEQNDRMTDLPISAPNLSMSFAAYILALRAQRGS